MAASKFLKERLVVLSKRLFKRSENI